MIIYKAVNKINGKIYVGQTAASLKKRIQSHLTAKTGIFPAALRKYGRDAFEFSIIDRADTQVELKDKEIYWIKFYGSKVPAGYNITDGGNGGMLGYKASEETKRKQSESSKGKNAGPKNGMYGKASPMRGKNHREESRKKDSESKKRNWQDPEYRRKILEARKSPSYKEGHRGSGRKRWSDPQYRKNVVEANKRKWQNPEYRDRQLKNLRENQKKRWKYARHSENQLGFQF